MSDVKKCEVCGGVAQGVYSAIAEKSLCDSCAPNTVDPIDSHSDYTTESDGGAT